MSAPPEPEPQQPRPGLRERKKAKTRALVQEQALRLFRERGYDETTVEQICDAAEISPATFYRYFGSKEEVVLHDRYDPLLLAAFEAQPLELSPIAALRRTLQQVFAGLPPEELEQERQRAKLILSVPELRSRTLDQFAEGAEMIAAVIARRTGRDAGEIAVVTLAGALSGVAVNAMLAAHRRSEDYFDTIDEALAQLEHGLPV